IGLRGKMRQQTVKQATVDVGHGAIEVARQMDHRASGGNACRHRSGVAISPATGLAPRPTALAAERSERARATTSWPRPTNARTTGAPIEPVPPRTRTRICFPLAHLDWAHV